MLNFTLFLFLTATFADKATAKNIESMTTNSFLPAAKLSVAALPNVLLVDHGSRLQLAKLAPSKIPTSSPSKVVPSSSPRVPTTMAPIPSSRSPTLRSTSQQRRVPSCLPTAAPTKAWTAPTLTPSGGYGYQQQSNGGGLKVPTSFPIAPSPRPTIGIAYISPIPPQSNARKIAPTRSPSGPSRRPTAYPTNPTARPTVMPTNPTATPTEEPTYNPTTEPSSKPLKK